MEFYHGYISETWYIQDIRNTVEEDMWKIKQERRRLKVSSTGNKSR